MMRQSCWVGGFACTGYFVHKLTFSPATYLLKYKSSLLLLAWLAPPEINKSVQQSIKIPAEFLREKYSMKKER